TKFCTREFQGDWPGGFVDTRAGPAMMLDHAHGIDWPFGAGELLARTAADEAVILSYLVQQMPEIEEINLGGPVDGLAVGDFDGDSNTDLAGLTGCVPHIRVQGGGLYGLDAFGPPGPCSSTAGDFDGDPIPDLVTVRADASFSVVTVHAPPIGPTFGYVGLPGAHQAAHPVN